MKHLSWTQPGYNQFFFLIFRMANDIISRELAICILFCTEYNETNVALLIKRINDMEDMEDVYKKRP
jgi:hypothetical protein